MAAVPENAGTEKIIEIDPIAEYDSKGTRLTCVTLADGEDLGPPVNGKRKRGGEDASASDIEEQGSSDSAWGDDDNDAENGSGEDENQEEEGEEELELEEDDSGEEND
jgi:protein MAK11